MNISQNIQSLIKEQKHTQKELAIHLGIATSTINNWIKLNRSIPAEYIIPICEFLDISPCYLLTGEERCPFSELSEDRQRLLNMYNLLDDMEKGEILGELKVMIRYRVDKDQQVRIAARSVGSNEPLDNKIPENADILDSIPTMKEE